MTVGPPDPPVAHDVVGDGDDVMPTNRTASRTAMTIIVFAAFFGSGGLNAGTPLAMASVPVSATEPPANALSSSRMPMRLGAERHGLGLRRDRGRPSR